MRTVLHWGKVPDPFPDFPLSTKGYLLSTARDVSRKLGETFAGHRFFTGWVMRYPRPSVSYETKAVQR